MLVTHLTLTSRHSHVTSHYCIAWADTLALRSKLKIAVHMRYYDARYTIALTFVLCIGSALSCESVSMVEDRSKNVTWTVRATVAVFSGSMHRVGVSS